MNIYIVYKTTNLVNGKFYIGKHKQTSIEFDGYLGSGAALKEAIKKYGRENFTRDTLAVFNCENECYHAEKKFLREHWQNRNCYNIDSGGKGGSKRIISEETRKKMSASRKGRTFSDESRKKMSQSHTGKKMSEEARENMSKGQTGKVTSEETKMKMSAIKKGKEHNGLFKSGYTPWNKGKTLSEEHKQKIAESRKNR